MDNEKIPEKVIRHKACYVGAPGIFALDQALVPFVKAFGGHACYLVGSALERPDWRDVDVRMMLDDEEFEKLFPDAPTQNASWEMDTRWRLLTVSLSKLLQDMTGLPVDFQIQPTTFANEKHKGTRHPLGIQVVK